MLTLLLADTELERVPRELTGHQQVVASARRAGVRANQMLLDSSLHHAAIRKAGLVEGERRGRPDLLHVFLLTVLESIANKAGHVQVLVHTRHDELIRIKPETRLVRNYGRFCGLVQQLFETGEVPPDLGLLTMQDERSLESIVKQVAPERVLILDDAAQPKPIWDVFSAHDGESNVLAIIGGFPSGTFRSPLPKGEHVGLGPTQLAVWTVAAQLLVNYERAARLQAPAKAAGDP